MTIDIIETSCISDAITSFLSSHDEMVFVQVGGYDGVSFDPLRPHILQGRMTGLILEPLPDNFAKLMTLYGGSKTIRPCCCAVAEEDGERSLWRFSPKAIAEGRLPPLFGGVSSFVMEDLLKEDGTLGSLYPPNIRAGLMSMLEAVPVPCRTFDSLFQEQGVKRVDLLQIDTEGYDYKLLRCFDFDRYRPAIVHYERQHMTHEEDLATQELMVTHGYHVLPQHFDILAIRPELISL